MSTGYIYILSNSSIPGLLKIGKTDRNPEQRAKELATTGVPSPFVLEFSLLVSDSSAAEKEIHQTLEKSGCRDSNSREFFRVPLTEAIELVRFIGGKIIRHTEDQSFSNTSKMQLWRLADGVQLPAYMEEISPFEADEISERLAAIGRMGLPHAMMQAARIYLENCKAALKFREYWREYLALYKKEVDTYSEFDTEGQRMKREVGQEVAEYLDILSKNNWLINTDLEFAQNFLIAGDQFVYEGFIRVVRDNSFSSSIREQCLNL